MKSQSYCWVFAVVFQSFKSYFVPSTFPNKGISVDVLEKYGFVNSSQERTSVFDFIPITLKLTIL
jgi:hypothetical protein